MLEVNKRVNSLATSLNRLQIHQRQRASPSLWFHELTEPMLLAEGVNMEEARVGFASTSRADIEAF